MQRNERVDFIAGKSRCARQVGAGGGREGSRKFRFGESKASQAPPPPTHTPLSSLLSLSLISLSHTHAFALPLPTKRQPTRRGQRGGEKRGVAPFCSNRRLAARDPLRVPRRRPGRDRDIVPSIGFHGEVLIWISDPIEAD